MMSWLEEQLKKNLKTKAKQNRSIREDKQLKTVVMTKSRRKDRIRKLSKKVKFDRRNYEGKSKESESEKERPSKNRAKKNRAKKIVVQVLKMNNLKKRQIKKNNNKVSEYMNKFFKKIKVNPEIVQLTSHI